MTTVRATTALLLTVALAGAAIAAEPPPAVRAEFDAALLRLADADRLPRGADESWHISQPPRVRHELGAVLDLAAAGAAGAAVLAVTPGGAAERAGLRSGDRVLALNGRRLQAGLDAEALHEALAAEGGALVIELRRDGREMELRGVADSISLPGYQLLLAGAAGEAASRCGRVSVFDAFPRSQQVYPVVLIAIDGRHPGDGPAYRLTPGRHRLTVSEAIDDRQFSGVAQFQRSRGQRQSTPDAAERLRSTPGQPIRDGARVLHVPAAPATTAAVPRGPSRSRYKDLEIDVRPGITYRIAAQFHVDRRHDIRGNGYWDPIVYAESPEPCD